MSFDRLGNGSDERHHDPETTLGVGGAVSIARESTKSSEGGGCSLAVVERSGFVRGCFNRGLESEFGAEILSFGSLAEIVEPRVEGIGCVALISIISLSNEESEAELSLLRDLPLGWRTVVLGESDDLDIVFLALNSGANGYVSTAMEIKLVVETLRFVSAGGTYVPPQCVIDTRRTQPRSTTSNYNVTKREVAVIDAICQGKPNKAIAYEMNMCESTVKVHLRHIMKKLHARNRTEVAIKGAELGLVSLERRHRKFEL